MRAPARRRWRSCAEHGGFGKHDCSANLHSLWDDILVSRRGHESVDVVAADLQARHRKPRFMGLGNCQGWARESLKLAATRAYPPTIFRQTKPTPADYCTVLVGAEPRLALAGYRLGEALNALLREKPSRQFIVPASPRLQVSWS